MYQLDQLFYFLGQGTLSDTAEKYQKRSQDLKGFQSYVELDLIVNYGTLLLHFLSSILILEINLHHSKEPLAHIKDS